MSPEEYYKKDKSVLLSVKPKWARAIVEGRKTVELRRKFPSDLPYDTKCFIYSTSPDKKILGLCWIIAVCKISPVAISILYQDGALVTDKEFDDYFQGCDVGYAIILSGAYAYDKPRTLEARFGKGITAPQSYRYIIE